MCRLLLIILPKTLLRCGVHELESSEVALDTILRVAQCFGGATPTPFAGLETLYRQQMYHRENFNLLVSLEKIPFGLCMHLSNSIIGTC